MVPVLLVFLCLYPFVFPLLRRLSPVFLNSSAVYAGPVLAFMATVEVVLSGNSWSVQLARLAYPDGSAALTLGLRLDALSGIILTSVMVIGTVIFRFSAGYLKDDPDRDRYFINMAWTQMFVGLMLLSQNLGVFFVSWVGISLFLHRLLLHFEDRSGARLAARQKFWISRLGDVFILIAVLALFKTFSTLDFDSILESVRDTNFVKAHLSAIQFASVFLVLGAMTKSAQFPLHFWLPNTMETPTPVSALMHAGIINAGGYLMIRMSPLLTVAPASLVLLVVVGGLSAFLASLVMLTQTNVKKALAYSTIAQMGFMLLECGLGAFSLATLHIVGHAFYKAYAFLSSGTTTDLGWLHRYFSRSRLNWSPSALLAMSLAVMALSLVMLFLAREKGFASPSFLALWTIWSFAILQVLLRAETWQIRFTNVAMILAFYLGLGAVFQWALDGIAATPAFGSKTLEFFAFVFVMSLTASLFMIQNSLYHWSHTELGQKFYVFFYNSGDIGHRSWRKEKSC